MHIAVLIPSHHKVPRELLQWTLEGYAEQVLGRGHTLEIEVGVDGAAVEGGPEDFMPGAKYPITATGFERMGAGAVRNRLAARTSAELLIFGNADARPDPGMVQAHVEAMGKLPRGSMVLGSAPWEKPGGGRATVFDALLAETPMVFFYSQLKAGEFYGFRQAWTLNLSVRREDFLSCGGFFEEIRPVYYEDLAFGYRLMGPEKKAILYEPAARVVHRHPTTVEQYLDREELLGLMAPVLGRVCPGAFRAVFGESVEALAAKYKVWVEMDRASHQWVYTRLKEWAGQPEAALDGAGNREAFLMALYQMHVPLKRLAFRLGYLRGMGMANDAHWREREVKGLWRGLLAGEGIDKIL